VLRKLESDFTTSDTPADPSGALPGQNLVAL